ncbi:unnamed protein product [Schistosoma mattheei]|uniref:Uncharacterized protein n=1 Tax=Schistosoma mattheei TaxID=31246 RepID=A0AA85BKU5_9TREM|nr:unnamed protein product [Schistosoma mattheei]
MFKYVCLFVSYSLLWSIQCRHQDFSSFTNTTTTNNNNNNNTNTTTSTSVADNRLIQIKGILPGVGLLIGILFILILLIKCCKPDKLTNSMNRNKISFSHHDETKIWSTSLESETTREYGDLQNDNYEYDGNQNTITNSSAYIMQSIDDDTSSLDLETQEMDENKWCTMSNNVTSLTIEKKQT